jgi:cell division protein FtsB
MRARRDREINIFNIAFLDVITGALGAFILLTILLVAQAKKSADPAELERLRKQIQEQTQEIQQLRKQNQEQAQEIQRLRQQQASTASRNQLDWELSRKVLSIITVWHCPKVKINTFMSADGQFKGEDPKPFDPAENVPSAYVGTTHFAYHSDEIEFDVWINSLIHAGRASQAFDDNLVRFFVSLREPLSLATPCAISTVFLAGDKKAARGSVISSQNPWALVGEVTVAKDYSITINPNAPLRTDEKDNIERWLQNTRRQRGQ